LRRGMQGHLWRTSSTPTAGLLSPPLWHGDKCRLTATKRSNESDPNQESAFHTQNRTRLVLAHSRVGFNTKDTATSCAAPGQQGPEQAGSTAALCSAVLARAATVMQGG
jgi:hypothetical protein